MTPRRALCLIAVPAMIAAPACADPAFENDAGGLPFAHVYSGGWEHFVGGGVAVFDCNGDAKPDLFAAGGSGPAALFVNRSEPGGALQFADGHAPEILETTGAYPLDINGDGVMDLAVLRVGANQLLRGLGNCQFEDATAIWGLPSNDAWTTAFTATWEAGQARPTLFFGNYVDRANPDGPFEACDRSQLIRPDGEDYGRVEQIDPGHCTLSALISDWQRNGDPQLRLSNDRHYYVHGGYEQMFELSPLHERPDWKHVSLWGMGIASRDITGDGLPEVMMTSMGDQLLQFNRGTGFENAPFAIGTYSQRPFFGDDGRPSTGWHAEFGDVDNDGRADLFIAKGNVDQMPSNAIHDPNNLLMQRADGTFVEKADVAGIATTDRSRGAALVDLNADGRLDLVVMNRRAPMELWRNVTADTGHWAGVALSQPGPNRNAVGAWVEIRSDGRVQSQEVTVGGGHAGGQAGPLHFGLGAMTQAEARVIWPDGRVDSWRSIAPDRCTQISRAD
ncbi:CRTAC1 family protein [Thioclava sp. 15-R06ZXC-3]|uniref:CRTAC1 family protein n=1 Tax=Thioclava arctica TaxID=3238301 RepID=A0ABV3TQR0_9RHOB